jgi:hypothetical protein
MTSRTFAPTTLALAATLVLGACLDEPFLRDNPLDIDADVSVEIVGLPDSLFSAGDTFRVSLVTDPPLPAGASIRWYGYKLESFGTGLFRVTGSSHEAAFATVTAELGPARVPREITRSVVVRQRIFNIVTRCDTGCRYTSLNWVDTVNTTPYDSLGSVVTGFFPTSNATLVSRDTNVMRVVHARVSNYWTAIQPRANGQTWIVMSFLGEAIAKDSFRVTVDQQLASVPNNCPISLYGSTSSQIVSSPTGYDSRGAVFQAPLPALAWDVGSWAGGNAMVASVTSTGLFTLHSGGYAAWETYQRTPSGTVVAGCQFNVFSMVDP